MVKKEHNFCDVQYAFDNAELGIYPNAGSVLYSFVPNTLKNIVIFFLTEHRLYRPL